MIGMYECEKVLRQKGYLDQFQGPAAGRAGLQGERAGTHRASVNAFWAERPALSGHL